jgi:hypothetical protein
MEHFKLREHKVILLKIAALTASDVGHLGIYAAQYRMY